MEGGEGVLNQIWEDIWCGEMACSNRFPALYGLSSFHNQSVISFVSDSSRNWGGECSWDLRFPRNFAYRELLGAGGCLR